jgi:hypothetical protein
MDDLRIPNSDVGPRPCMRLAVMLSDMKAEEYLQVISAWAGRFFSRMHLTTVAAAALSSQPDAPSV